MKSIIALSLALVSALSFADQASQLGKKCFKQAKRYYHLNGSRSDIPLGFNFVELLPAGKTLKIYDERTIAKFEEDKLIYSVTGSFHSGYFNDITVVDPKTCDTDEILNIYSE